MLTDPGRQTTRELVGQELILQVGPVAHGGHCVARHEGQVVFVRHALPGEQVRARITKGKPGARYLFADAVEVLHPSALRVEPPCRYAGAGGCGGCDFQHVDLAGQRRLKADVVIEQMRRLGGVEVDLHVQPVAGDQDGLRWRSRISLAVDREGRTGFHPHHSHEVMVVDDCLIATQQVVSTGALQGRYPGAKRVDVVASNTGRGALVVLPRDARSRHPVREQVTLGTEVLQFRLDARSFWQIHPGAATTLLGEVLRLLQPRGGERALDLYAGAGLFARGLADAIGSEGAVLAVEEDPRAADAARRWADGRDEVEVRTGRVERVLRPLVDGGDHVDLVVLDPPRAGAGADVVDALVALHPRALAYAACDPAALARDTTRLRAGGYRLVELQAFDIYPMTHHVECVALFHPDSGSSLRRSG